MALNWGDFIATWSRYTRARPGQLGGSAAEPIVTGITETSGPTALPIGAIANGQLLKRVGCAIVGVAPPVTDVAWGGVTGTLSAQTDLQAVLDSKGTSNFSGAYNDLTGKPSLFDGVYASLTSKPTLFDGVYASLTSKPTLGTAAATASSDYATAAQGTTANSALQPAGNGSALTGMTKGQVGLGSVDNTADSAKPVSSATQTALDDKQAALVSGTNIKTVNGSTLLGSGNLAVSSSDPTYTMGSFTVATETAKILSRHLRLLTAARSTLAGTSTLRIT